MDLKKLQGELGKENDKLATEVEELWRELAKEKELKIQLEKEQQELENRSGKEKEELQSQVLCLLSQRSKPCELRKIKK